MNPQMHSRNQAGRQHLAIASVAYRLLDEPNWTLSTKTEWRYGRMGSLSVDLEKNTWFDHEAREGGGVLDLVCRIHGGSHREALAWLRDAHRLGANDLSVRCHRPDNGRKRRFALENYNASVDADRTEVETYLRGRQIAGLVPSSLRFHANLEHTGTGLYFPAMVAGVQALSSEVIAIHRTYLQPCGRGKAQVSRPKMALGSLKDGAVRLAPPGIALGLTEGIETGLSAQQLFEIPVWACLSCSRYTSVAIPDQVIEVQIFADNDDAGLEAARKAAEHWTALGRRVVVRRPPDIFGDWNDVLPHWHERPVDAWEF